MGKKAREDGSYVALDKCYYCMEDKDVIFSTRLRDISSLHGSVTNMEPCKKCKEYMKEGVILVSIRDGESQEGSPPNPYRTGGWWVLKVEAVKRIFDMDFTGKLQKFMFIEDSIADAVGLKKGGT